MLVSPNVTWGNSQKLGHSMNEFASHLIDDGVLLDDRTTVDTETVSCGGIVLDNGSSTVCTDRLRGVSVHNTEHIRTIPSRRKEDRGRAEHDGRGGCRK